MSGNRVRTALYRCYDDDDTLLYIGISKDFGQRWKSEAKEFSWWPQVRRQTVYWHDSREEAEAAEEAAVKAERPRHNKRHARSQAHDEVVALLEGPLAPLLLTYKQSAALLDVSMSKLFQMLRAGEIRSVKLGPQTARIPTDECEAYAKRKIAEAKDGKPAPPVSGTAA